MLHKDLYRSMIQSGWVGRFEQGNVVVVSIIITICELEFAAPNFTFFLNLQKVASTTLAEAMLFPESERMSQAVSCGGKGRTDRSWTAVNMHAR